MNPIERTATVLAPVFLAWSCLLAPRASADETKLVVNGEVIPEQAIRREIVYQLGSRELEVRKLEILLDKELEARGKKAEDVVSDAEIDGMVQKSFAKFDEEYGGRMTREELLAKQRLTVESARRNTRINLLFDRLFFPENPSEWPEISRQALAESLPPEEQGQFFEKMQEAYDQRVAEGVVTDPSDPGRMMFNQLLRGSIMGPLSEAAEVATAGDGIAPEVAMTVHGVAIPVDEVFASIRKELSPLEMERTRLWLAKTTAVRQDLVAKGVYLDDEEFAAKWKALEEKHVDSFFPLPNLVLGIKKFPSLDAYRVFRRALESYKESIEKELTDEALTKHLPRANRLMGLEEVDSEVILLSAYDFKVSQWKPDGWADAERRAGEVARKLADGGDWNALLEEYSDFWDEPIPASKMAQPDPNWVRRNKGRFGPKNRNSLLQILDENEFLIFLYGSSIADQIFFDQEVGTVAGPFRGPYGYYITTVKGRKPSTRSFSLAESRERESVLNDYLLVRFDEYAAEVFAQSKVEGL